MLQREKLSKNSEISNSVPKLSLVAGMKKKSETSARVEEEGSKVEAAAHEVVVLSGDVNLNFNPQR